MKKRDFRFLILCLFFGFFSSVCCFSASGLLFGEKDLRCISTQWFDIIFPAKSVESAKKIYDSADEIYYDICATMGTDPRFRMTVTISPATDVFNAYFNNYPSNHIVLYDTTPMEELTVFENDLVGTFRHELTHAVTINMTNSFWRTIDAIFGDVYIPGLYLNMDSFICEGSAVLEESRGGFGRLNNGFYLHMIRQSLIQGDFDSYTQVTGAFDTTPGGSLCYGFGGPFMEWLKNTYGEEKYSDFWYRGVNLDGLTYEWVFYNTYGFPMWTAWEQFKDSLDYPKIEANPTTVDGIEIYKWGCEPKSLYGSMSVGCDGAYWLDSRTHGIYRGAKEDGALGKPQKIMKNNYSSSIKVSVDGKYLTVISTGLNHANYKKELEIRDLESGKTIKAPGTGYRDALIFDGADEKKYLAAIKSDRGRNKLEIFTLDFDEKLSIKKLSALGEYVFDLDSRIFSLTDGGDGRIAFAMFDGSFWSICLADFESGKLNVRSAKLDSGVAIRNLSRDCFASGLRFNFSWATKSVLPRLGFVDFEEDSAGFCFMDKDISGGVYFPVSIDENHVAYVGNFVRENKILLMDKSCFGFTEKIQHLENLSPMDSSGGVDFSSAEDFQNFLGDSKKYVPGFSRGSIIPYGEVPLYNSDGALQSGIRFPTLSYVCASPWDGTTLVVSGGVNFENEILSTFLGNPKFCYGFNAALSGEMPTGIFSYTAGFQTAFDSVGYLQSSINCKTNFSIPFGGTGFFAAKNNALLFFGRDFYSSHQSEKKYLTFNDDLSLSVGSKQKTGPGDYQVLYFKFNLNFNFTVKNSFDASWTMANEGNKFYWYPSMTMAIPNLIPVNCHRDFVYNLPVHINLSWGTDPYTAASAFVSVLLFDWEVQNGPMLLPFYIKRFSTSLGYSASFVDKNGGVNPLTVVQKFSSIDKLTYMDSIKLTMGVDISPNTGAITNGAMFVGAGFTFFPHHSVGEKPYNISFETSLNF